MTSTQKGAFCTSCRKEVIDFTNMSDREVREYFNRAKGKTCGRFKEVQVDKVYSKPMVPQPFWKWSTAAMLALVTTSLVNGQNKNNVSENSDLINFETYHVNKSRLTNKVDPSIDPEISIKLDTVFILKGKVVTDYGESLPGAEVKLIGKRKGISTDIDGKFSIEIPKNCEGIEVSFVGFLDKKINKEQLLTEGVQIVLIEDVVMGEIVIYPWYSPRTWWWKIKSIFN
jgi:hypothetical protein